MIGRLRGVLVASSGESICIDVGGVGYDVRMTPRGLVALPGVGEEVVVHIHTHVREDELGLYGFDSEGERDLFRILLGASGVGTKVAMSMLGTMTPTEIVRSIASEDSDALTVVPGIGKRGAQKIVLELALKLSGHDVDVLKSATAGTVRDALESLGYTTDEINGVINEVDLDSPVQDQVKAALKALGGR